MPTRTDRFLRQVKVLAAPFLVFTIIIVVTLGLHDISRRAIYFNLEQSTRENCYKVVNLLQANLRERIAAVRQLANYFRISDSVAEGTFRGQSRFVMAQIPELLTIVATDAGRNPVWIESGDNKLSPDLVRRMMSDPSIEAAVERSIGIRDYSISEMFTVRQLGDCFALLIPYEKEGRPAGFIYGFFSHSRLLNSLLLPELQGDFRFQLRQASKRVYDSYLFSASSREASLNAGNENISVVEDFFFVGPQLWAVKVESSGVARANPAYFTSDMILILGGILALLLGAFTYFQQWRLVRFQSEAWVSRNRLASASLSLAQIQENFDLIINNVREAIILYDEDLHPLQANVEFKTAFGALQAGKMFENSEAHHKAMSGHFRGEPRYWTLLNALRENPEAPVTDTVETIPSTDDATVRYYQRRAASVTRPDGSRRGYLVIYQDITETRSIEKLKEDFLSSVTHDLRTPLASIKGFAETMLRDTAMDNATRNEFLSIIRDESRRLEEMIEDLLDVRRMEEGRFDLRPASYELKSLLDEIIRGLQPILEAGDQRIVVDWTGDDRGTLFGDVSKIGRALRNILGNAMKYSPPHKDIHVRILMEERRAELDIEDAGPGIPPDELGRIFEKFYRGSRHVRRTKGTGLGLAIVKHIVESHGGIVSASNRPGGGTCIRVVLPRRMEFWEDRLEPASENLRAGTAAQGAAAVAAEG